MRVVVACSSSSHPVYPYLERWVANTDPKGHEVSLVNRVDELPDSGDLLFLVSFGQIIGREYIDRFQKALVLHCSDLPRGRGWSPHIWEVLRGADHLTLSLLEAADRADVGDIWKKQVIPLDGTELYDEINAKLFQAEIELMDYAVENFATVSPQAQPELDEELEYYQKRTPADSEIDPSRVLADQFDLLRVCDPQRFPAFFDFRGARYLLRIEKAESDEA